MPDFQSHSVQVRPNQTLSVNVFRVQARVVDSQTQVLLPGGDFTGANAIDMALTIPGLGAQAHKEIAESIAQSIMRRRLGLE